MKHTTLFALSAMSLIALASCGNTSQGKVHKAQEVAANILLPAEQEEQLGQEFQKELNTQLKYHPNPNVQSYIQALGNRVVQHAQKDAPDISFEFRVVDDNETVNAFAIPGGAIYIYSGLLLQASDESEVVGVLGHEVAHVTERHVAERLVTANGINLVTAMALGQDPAMVGQVLAGVAGQGYLLKFGRDQEREADARGFEYVISAGYDPAGMEAFFRKLAAMQGGASSPSFLASHPNPGERADTIRSMRQKRKTLPEFKGEARYAEFKPSLRVASDVQTATTPTTPDSTTAPALTTPTKATPAETTPAKSKLPTAGPERRRRSSN